MISISEIAAHLGATVHGNGAIVVAGLTEPAAAGPDDLALAMSPRYGEALAANTAVKAAVVWADADWKALGLDAAIVVSRPRLAMAGLTQAFDRNETADGIHPLADVAPDAVIGDGVFIGAFVSIGAGASIGDGTRIDSHASVAAGSVIGAGCSLRSGVRISHNVTLGDGVILHPNVVIGADGFSFVTATPSHPETGLRTLGKTPFQPMDGTLHRIHSLGGVIIADDVEVGANSTVDAGTIRATQVGRGTKIDNLVQVGHNVIVGEDCLLCAQAAVAGSTVIGDRVVMGGKSGAADNIKIGSDVVLGGAAIALGDIPSGSFVMGYPAVPMLQYRAQQRQLRQAARPHKAVSKSTRND
ncbi:UDP-3-O-(3-hydroxymyristoyl)glucosamine N-acyltransferase [Yoonia sp. 208BN28-4]|uniref:UDP-3-O-(3-hydroxymyristoyl)glucosamine N-acyltransferase n=1 Tax=Yoonia sp. 208BN28-4 TaxID=3126505 RepID=UPI0030B65BA2